MGSYVRLEMLGGPPGGLKALLHIDFLTDTINV